MPEASPPEFRQDVIAVVHQGNRTIADSTRRFGVQPWAPHQDVVGNRHLMMRAACPPALKVVLAPFDVVLADDTAIVPDLLVAAAQPADGRQPARGAAAVGRGAVASTRRFDRLVERERLQEAGCRSFWLIDLGDAAVTVLELRDGTSEQVAHVVGDQAYDTRLPFPVRLVPSELQD